jgi:hypothetical protein
VPGFSFRIKLPKSRSATLLIDEPRIEWHPDGDSPVLVLSSGDDDVSLRAADTLYFKGDGWPSKEEAWDAARCFVAALARTFARLRVGVDLGVRAQHSGRMSQYLIDKMLEEHGARIINEAPGIMVYETDPAPLFASASASVALGVSRASLDAVFAEALRNQSPLQDHESVALDLFNASFFQKTPESRFLLLMIAVEALLDPAPRSSTAVAHVEDLLRRTRDSGALTEAEKQSICGSLEWLRRESIGNTGRVLVSKQLEGKEYQGTTAAQFFTRCYALRSRLVHGIHPMPTRSEIGHTAANLEVLVSDLLAGELRDVSLVPSRLTNTSTATNLGEEATLPPEARCDSVAGYAPRPSAARE